MFFVDLSGFEPEQRESKSLMLTIYITNQFVLRTRIELVFTARKAVVLTVRRTEHFVQEERIELSKFRV